MGAMRIGAYEVAETLGKGGAGTVFRARAPDGREVAVKLLNRTDAESLARFERERRLLAALSAAEGFVPLLDAGTADAGVFLVMPCLRGGTLRDWLARGPLGVETTLALGSALARAIARAHALGIVHRDLKPENILFATKPGVGGAEPLVADLGLAKHFREDAPGASQSVQLSRAGELRGTAGYMAPEQMRSSQDVGTEADVFALGAILHECLAGEPAFVGDNLLLLFAKVEQGERRPLRSACPGAPRALVETIDRALATDPAKRFRDASELARALDGTSARPRPLARLIAVAVIVLAAALALTARRPETTASPGEVTPGPVTKPETTPVTTAAAALPAWFRQLPAGARPDPLPPGIAPTETPREYRNARDGTILVFVPGGPFLMGTADARLPDALPIHEVVLSPFFIAKLELTNERFAAFVAATGYATEAETGAAAFVVGPQAAGWSKLRGATWLTPDGPKSTTAPDHPVRQVSWDDAAAYAAWAGLALPTEAQWEKAALWDPEARRSRRYTWGDEPPSASSRKVANLADETAHRKWPRITPYYEGYDDGYERTAPAESFPEGVSPCGALNLIGNVAEWCRDGYDPVFYAASPARDPVRGAEGLTRHVWRGGNYVKVYPGAGYFRGFREFHTSSDTVGFRCALTLAP
jgi:formylglycine-generating enzyme required for sulfatase activity